MFAKRIEFNKKMILLISFLVRNNGDYHYDFSKDLVQLIYDYIPGKDGTLRLKQNQTMNLKSDVQYEFDNVIIPFAAHLKVKSWDPLKRRGGRLIIHCFDTIHIRKGGSIDLSTSGYYGGRSALCCGGSYDEEGPRIQRIKSDYGAGGGGQCAGGGSYGTKGTDGTLDKRKPDLIVTSNTVNAWNGSSEDEDDVAALPNDKIMDIGYAGNIYGDSMISHLYLGSGGGSSFWSGGGRGGGALYLITNNLTNSGKIDCSGGIATEYGSGGGSGGSIIIDALSELNLFGDIKANGGRGMPIKNNRKSFGGKGGDGRICINNKELLMDNAMAFCINMVWPKPYITWSIRTDNEQYRL